MVKADAAFDAWTSKDIKKMTAALNVFTNQIDRHFLLQTLVAETYRLRNDPAMRKACRKAGEIHIQEFPTLAPPLRQDLGVMPRVTTFQHLSTIFTEDGEFDRAIEICQLAEKYGLDDGTKGGYAARIAKIEKLRG
jgi:hypothetical protein